MKKLLLAILFVGSICYAQAQPSLTCNEMLPFGSTLNFSYAASFSVIDTTIQGANVTWNFSALSPSATTGPIVQIVNPASTPNGIAFPDANYCYKETPTAYRYFKLSSDKFERIGSFTSSLRTYTDSQIEMTFPFALNTANNDTWETSSGGTGDYDFNCIGYGTLVLPSGTYNAFLTRVFTTSALADLYSYMWYSSDNGAILLQYIIGDGFFYSTSAMYINSLTIDVSENKVVESIKYNNPVDNTLNVSFEAQDVSEIEYVLTNTVGGIVMNGTVATVPSQANSLSLDVSSLKPGMYFMTIRSAKTGYKPEVIKVIKK